MRALSPEFIPVRVPSVLSANPILQALVGPDANTPAPMTFAIHPLDLAELRQCYLYCWPGNAPADVFMGVKLTSDFRAARLPRVPL